jgi:mannose-1-phosphate guanylyltransferase
METEKLYAVIMAGGRGTRFWPASVRKRPKQFMNLLGGGTMIQLTAGRFRNLTRPDRVVVVTGALYETIVLEQLPLLNRQNLLLEPSGRNTAACIGWAAETLRRRGEEDAVMIVAASDHMIEPLSGFESTVRKAVSLADKGYLCTIGIPPGHPATGYGYLQRGEMLSPGWKVKSFKEKPDAQTAESYLESGDFFWNSGMFVWKVGAFLDEMKKFMPGLSEAIRELPETTCPPAEMYEALESQSVDYGIMELTERAVMVPAEFSWSDIGDWPGAKNAGVGRGRSILLDSSNTMVFDETGRLTVLIGINDACVVTTATATLVMADSCSQSIKKVIEELDSEMPDLV